MSDNDLEEHLKSKSHNERVKAYVENTEKKQKTEE